MPPAVTWLCVVVFALIAPSCTAVTIRTEADLDLSASCVPKTTEPCNGIAGLAEGTLIRINSTAPEAVLAASATAALAELSILKALGYGTCQSALEAVICLSIYVPCTTYAINSTNTVVLPEYQCKNACESGQPLCEVPLQIGGRAYPDCVDDIVWDFSASGGSNFSANCTTGEEQRAVPCIPTHEVYLSKREADGLTKFCVALGWICAILDLLIIGLYIANPQLRPWPGPVVIALAVGFLFMSIGCLLPGFLPDRRDLFCDGGAVRSLGKVFSLTSVQAHNVCIAQGVFLISAILITMSSWLALTITTLMLVSWRNPKALMGVLKRRWYLVMSYLVVPIVLSAIAFRDLGSTPQLLFCAITNSRNFEYYVIWPVAGIMCVGTICWCATVVLLVVSFARSELSYKRDVALYARLILYELVALIPACFVVLPFETIRDEILGQDKEIFYNGKLRRHAICITVGTVLSTIVFSVMFILQRKHIAFVRGLAGLSSSTSTRSVEPEEDGAASKF